MKLFMETKELGYEDIAQTQTEYARLLSQIGEPNEASLLFDQANDVYRKLYGERVVTAKVAENLLYKVITASFILLCFLLESPKHS
jgi:hypothetical protein